MLCIKINNLLSVMHSITNYTYTQVSTYLHCNNILHTYFMYFGF